MQIVQPIRMSRKIDRYLATPGDFVDDLDNQARAWMAHIVRPLGNAYEASEARFDRVREIAQRRHQEQQARLAKIEAAIGVALSIVFMATDIVGGAAASRAINVQRRFTSRRGIQTFLNGRQALVPAIRGYLSQSDTFSDALLGNIDSTLRGLFSTSSLRSGSRTLRSLTSNVSSSVSTLAAHCDAAFDGPLEFQNRLVDYYEGARSSIFVTYVHHVRDGDGDSAFKRAVLESLVSTPFCRPPPVALSIGRMHLETYFEICRYCLLIAEIASSGNRGFGLLNDMGGELADTINQRLLQLTRHYFNHTGGGRLIASNISYRPAGDIPLALPSRQAGLRDFQTVWDGFCSLDQSRYSKVIMASARSSYVDIYMDTLATQATQFYTRS